MTEENVIEFKGTRHGLMVYIKPDYEFKTVKKQLINRLDKTQSFFKGAKIFQIKGDMLSKEEKKELEEIMTSRYKMYITKSVTDTSTGVEDTENKVFSGIVEGETKFVRGTIRSGQRIEFDGNIVIVGDVNPGAQITALGNIIVMGSLRGIAHAGANGNKEACVAALYLDPMQLRIADIIARAPDGNYEGPDSPELARVRGDMVYIEPYLSKK